MPTVSAEFVWRMEDILALYAAPYDPQYPVVCVDESPDQLIGETRQPLPVLPGHRARYDDEYRRLGTCNLFMLFQPLQGWRHVKVTDRRTAKDLAHGLRELVDVPCMKPSRRRKPVACCGSWIFATPPSMAAGSIWRQSRSPWCPSKACTSGCPPKR